MLGGVADGLLALTEALDCYGHKHIDVDLEVVTSGGNREHLEPALNTGKLLSPVKSTQVSTRDAASPSCPWQAPPLQHNVDDRDGAWAMDLGRGRGGATMCRVT
jgi:hypothetical protein